MRLLTLNLLQWYGLQRPSSKYNSSMPIYSSTPICISSVFCIPRMIIGCSNRKECKQRYPLHVRLATKQDLADRLDERKKDVREGDEEGESMTELESHRTVSEPFNAAFVQSMMKKIDWPALVLSAESVGLSLPASYSESDLLDNTFLQLVHQAITEVSFTILTSSCLHRLFISSSLHPLPPNSSSVSNNIVSSAVPSPGGVP